MIFNGIDIEPIITEALNRAGFDGASAYSDYLRSLVHNEMAVLLMFSQEPSLMEIADTVDFALSNVMVSISDAFKLEHPSLAIH